MFKGFKNGLFMPDFNFKFKKPFAKCNFNLRNFSIVLFLCILIFFIPSKISALEFYLFSTLPEINIGFEYGSKLYDLFSEDLDTVEDYNYLNLLFKIKQKILKNFYFTFQYKYTDYNFILNPSNNRIIHYFYNRLKIKFFNKMYIGINLNFKFSDYQSLNEKDFNFLYPGFNIRWGFAKGSFIYLSYRLYYRFGSLYFYDYIIHRIYSSFKYEFKPFSLKISGSLNFQYNYYENSNFIFKYFLGIYFNYKP